MKAILLSILDLIRAIGGRILAEPVLTLAAISDLLVILAAVRVHQPISDALILDLIQTLLAIAARSRVTPTSKLPMTPPTA